MKVLQSGSLDVKSGGPALSTYLTLKGLKENGVSAEIIMPPLCKGGKLITDDIDVHYTLLVRNRRFGYMPKLANTLLNLGKYDLYHIQGIWQYLGHGVASYARKNNKPYIVTLRGMMYPQALAHSAIVKKISLLLYQRKDLNQAACIQATCIEEMNYYRSLGFMNPVAVLPNPIEVTNIIDRPIRTNSCFRIGYLGRIHPRKRIERLIYAFDTLRNKLSNAELLIIGADDREYEEFLHKEVEWLHLKNVRFTGFLTGKEKDEAIMSLSYLVVPSDFENFGNIVTEALVRGVPVIASKGMPWKDLEDYHCGWWINNDQDTINGAIMMAYNTSEKDRIQMGLNGKQLMRNKYSVEVLGLKMKQLYEWILNGGEKPDFVYE